MGGARRVTGRRQRLHRFEGGIVRIVAFDTGNSGLISFGPVPKPIPPTVRAPCPIAISRAMAFGAELNDGGLANFRAIVIDEGVAVGWVMAVEAKSIVAVPKLDPGVFNHGQLMTPARSDQSMAIGAIVTPAEQGKLEPARLAGQLFVKVRIVGRSRADEHEGRTAGGLFKDKLGFCSRRLVG